MKSITISRRLKFINKLLQQASQENIILQSADEDKFLLTRITLPFVTGSNINDEVEAFIVGESEDFAEEIARTRQNTELMAFLDERAAQAKPGKNGSLEEIRRRLGE